MKKPKYIIQNDILIIGKIIFHEDLVTDKTAVIKGGGWYKYDHETKTFTFYKLSTQFGMAKLEDVKKCVENNKVYLGGRRVLSNTTHKFEYLTIKDELIKLN